MFVRLGQLNKSIKVYNRALEISPQYALDPYGRTMALLGAGQWQVFMTGDESNATMAFVIMPANFTAEEVSKPVDSSVKVRELPAGRFAVMRYSGGRNAKNERKALYQLKQWMASERMAELSPPVYGYFDPPWTPRFLRRNEVMFRTDSGH